MSFSNVGIPSLILILIIGFVMFGPSRLPQIGKIFGTSFKEFKQ